MASVNMNFIFILSVILKGIGAVLEIALQILLTKLIAACDETILTSTNNVIIAAI